MKEEEFYKIMAKLNRIMALPNITSSEKADYLIKIFGIESFHKLATSLAQKQLAEFAPPFVNYDTSDCDIIAYLTDFFQRYQNQISSLDCAENANLTMQAFIESERQQMGLPHIDITFDLLSEVNIVCKMIIDALKKYFSGFPSDAYMAMEETMTHNNGHLLNLLPQIEIRGAQYLYRVRKGEQNEIKELFHVPFEKRELCESYRYSIAGIPSLYCGTSLITSIKETRISPRQKFSTTIFRYKDSREIRAFVDLALPFGRELNLMDQYCLLVFYPLIVACGLKVRKDEYFKPEYIIPQLFYQFIRNNDIANFKGISYTSTRYDHPDFTDYRQRNYVLFVKHTDHGKGYDDELADSLQAITPQSFEYISEDDLLKIENELKQQPFSDFKV